VPLLVVSAGPRVPGPGVAVLLPDGCVELAAGAVPVVVPDVPPVLEDDCAVASVAVPRSAIATTQAVLVNLNVIAWPRSSSLQAQQRERETNVPSRHL
jgi:hypothetical protein